MIEVLVPSASAATPSVATPSATTRPTDIMHVLVTNPEDNPSTPLMARAMEGMNLVSWAIYGVWDEGASISGTAKLLVDSAIVSTVTLSASPVNVPAAGSLTQNSRMELLLEDTFATRVVASIYFRRK